MNDHSPRFSFSPSQLMPRMPRRTLLTCLTSTILVGGTGAGLAFLYPGLSGQFGGVMTVGKKKDFPAALLDAFKMDKAGVFHLTAARTYLVHMTSKTHFFLGGSDLKDQLQKESIVVDSDGSYWIALYQRCVHLGCTVPFRDDCVSFKCPCHGSHYNVDGEYLDGPAPRSLDRFELSFNGEDVQVNTGALNKSVAHPDPTTRLIAVPTVDCSPG